MSSTECILNKTGEMSNEGQRTSERVDNHCRFGEGGASNVTSHSEMQRKKNGCQKS